MRRYKRRLLYMKKKYITIQMLGMTALLTACSGGSEPGTGGIDTLQQYAITFGAADGQVEQVTRASSTTPLSEKGYTEMKVYGYKTLNSAIQNVMPGYTMKYTSGSANSTTSNSSGWEYVGQGKDYLGNAQEIKYWDGNSSDYRFFGVLPKTASDGTKTYPTLTYKASSASDETVSDSWNKQSLSTDGSFTLTFSGLEYMTRKQVTTKGDDESDVTNVAYYKADGTAVNETAIPIYCHLWQGNPSANYSNPVTLEFVKPYSLVRLVFVRPAGSTTTQLGKEGETDTDGNISHTHDITFGPVSSSSAIASSGNVTITYPMTGSEETYAVNATTGSTTLSKMSLGTVTLTEQDVKYQAWPEYVMIPTNSSGSTMVNGDFKCTAYIYTQNGSKQDVFTERTAVVPAQYMQWKPGYQYTYVFKITANNNLEFSHVVEVYTKWQAGYVDKTTW